MKKGLLKQTYPFPVIYDGSNWLLQGIYSFGVGSGSSSVISLPQCKPVVSASAYIQTICSQEPLSFALSLFVQVVRPCLSICQTVTESTPMYIMIGSCSICLSIIPPLIICCSLSLLLLPSLLPLLSPLVETFSTALVNTRLEFQNEILQALFNYLSSLSYIML